MDWAKRYHVEITVDFSGAVELAHVCSQTTRAWARFLHMHRSCSDDWKGWGIRSRRSYIGLEGGFSEEKSAARERAKPCFAPVGDGGVVLSTRRACDRWPCPQSLKALELGAGDKEHSIIARSQVGWVIVKFVQVLLACCWRVCSC